MRRTQRSGEVKTADLRFSTCAGEPRTRASDARHLEQRISGDFRPQLSRGDGIDGTSVYLAFGSKEKLFEQAFQLHLQEGAPGLRSLREQSPGKEAIRCMLKNGVTVLPRDRLTSFGMSLQNALERRLCPHFGWRAQAQTIPGYRPLRGNDPL